MHSADCWKGGKCFYCQHGVSGDGPKGNDPPAGFRPLDKLVAAVRESVRAYDATGDHILDAHRSNPNTDCIRCQLVRAIGRDPVTFR